MQVVPWINKIDLLHGAGEKERKQEREGEKMIE